MNIKEAVDYLNFWIKKERGSFFTIEESVNIIDLAQMAYFNDVMPRYATSQIIKDTLQPFKTTYSFTTNDTTNGLITIDDPNYLDLLDCTINFTSDGRSLYYSIKIIMNQYYMDKPMQEILLNLLKMLSMSSIYKQFYILKNEENLYIL
jgi:hypothetical protein